MTTEEMVEALQSQGYLVLKPSVDGYWPGYAYNILMDNTIRGTNKFDAMLRAQNLSLVPVEATEGSDDEHS